MTSTSKKFNKIIKSIKKSRKRRNKVNIDCLHLTKKSNIYKHNLTAKYLLRYFEHKGVNKVFAAVENRIHDVNLTSMDFLFMSGIEQANRSNNGSSPDSIAQTPNERQFLAITENAPMTQAYSRAKLKVN